MTALQRNTRPSMIGRPQLISEWLVRNVLPLGWVAVLTGMFWAGDRSLYHKIYYLLLASPALAAILLRPQHLKPLLSSPLLITFSLFSLYALATLAWSSTDTSFGSLAKRPVYIFVLFLSAGLLALQAPSRLMIGLQASAVIATLAALISLGIYLHSDGPERLTGYGALYNPLLSSHVYGAFLALWMAQWFLQKTPLAPAPLLSLAILGTLIIATGSRTPLLALTVCATWLVLITWNKRSLLLVLAIGVLLGSALLTLDISSLASRGLSSRPEIWAKTWLQILDAPWFGHGYDAPMAIWISTHDFAMADPHNMMLAVLYYCGAVGLTLWLLLYTLAFKLSWRNRRDPLTVVASSMVVFGLAASMTEGGAFLSRPKEHWFLIWIPMALLFAAEIKIKSGVEHLEVGKKA